MKRLNNILANSHLNTIIPIYLTQNIKPQYIRERLITPDNDFIDLDWINKDLIDSPIVVLFHGTEGNSKSHYAKRIMFYLEQIGWRGVVPHFRGCSEELNIQPKFYHAGDFEDMIWVLEQIKKTSHREIFAVGVSLGGNALLKFLGEHSSQTLITAAMAISVPFDLDETVRTLDHGFNKHVYVKTFLQSLLPKMRDYAKQFGNIEIADHKIDTLDEFNNTYICQFYGFKDSKDYYQQTSCRGFLKDITIPTLILQAENDPMIPVNSWPNKSDLSHSTRFVSTKTGGHAGFINLNSNYKEDILKMPKFMLQYFNQYTKDSTIQAEPFDQLELNFMED